MILFINDLTVIDSSYLCHERGMLGESWIVDLELEGELNEMSMLFDFSRVKKHAKQLIDDIIDHKLIVPIESQALNYEAHPHNCYVDFFYGQHSLHLASPASAFCCLPSDKITNEAVTKYLEKALIEVLPKNIGAIKLNLRHEDIHGVYYHYTHGLKKHDGNCQRIAHGHRSKIDIYENDMRSPAREKIWAERWRDIYLATAEDQSTLETAQFSQQGLAAITDHGIFYYEAEQGQFSLAMPQHTIEVLPCDTTVECIADFIAATLKQQIPTSTFRVVAYEGVKKGAIA